ncbi:MAG: hypothetical protein ACRELA_22645 [Candidatus Rokuibacteriota bacterium]
MAAIPKRLVVVKNAAVSVTNRVETLFAGRAAGLAFLLETRAAA